MSRERKINIENDNKQGYYDQNFVLNKEVINQFGTNLFLQKN